MCERFFTLPIIECLLDCVADNLIEMVLDPAFIDLDDFAQGF
jgi:hypothetical protein